MWLNKCSILFEVSAYRVRGSCKHRHLDRKACNYEYE